MTPQAGRAVNLHWGPAYSTAGLRDSSKAIGRWDKEPQVGTAGLGLSFPRAWSARKILGGE